MDNKKRTKRKWIIRIIIFLLIPLISILVLYFTNNVAVTAIIGIVLLFIWNLLKGGLTNYISDSVFPKKDRVEETYKLATSLLDNIKIDPRVIKKYLNDLSSQSTTEKKKAQINKWYDDFKIDSKLKDILIVIIEHKEATILSLEKRIKAESNSDYANALKNLKSFLQTGEAAQIKDNYLKFAEQQKKETIELLKISIDASKQLFAFDDTIDLYGELNKLEPSAENHFIFGVYLQELNYFDRALEKYTEALAIYRDLAKENPRTYLPDVAMTLNNLAVLQKAKNEFPQALKKYTEALAIYRDLAKDNPHRYEIDYAQLLIMGVALFGKNKHDITSAKTILEKYNDVPRAHKLLTRINELEETSA